MDELNLLDPQRIQRQRQQVIVRIIARTAIWLFLLSLVTLGGLLAIGYSLHARAKDLETELQKTRVVSPSGRNLPVAETTKEINLQLTALRPILSEPTVPEQLKTFLRELPAGITLSELTISAATKTVSGAGIAATRNDIPLLQAKIASIPNLLNPIVTSNINDRTRVKFTLTAGFQTQISDSQ